MKKPTKKALVKKPLGRPPVKEPTDAAPARTGKHPVRKPRKGIVSKGNFSEEEREIIKNHCARLYLEGYSNYGMMQWMAANTEWTISQPTVRKYIDDILEDWHAQRITDIDKAITGQLMKLQRAEREAWDAWERSKKPQMKKVSRKRGTPKMNKETGAVIAVTATEFEDVEETIESVGDFRFLELFNRLVVQQMEVLNKGGFNKPDDPTIYTGNNFTQNIVYVGVVDRKPPADYTPKTIDLE